MFSFDLIIMHALEAVDIRIYLSQKIMITQYKPRAMNFVLTWENLISLILHCLIHLCRSSFCTDSSIHCLSQTLKAGKLKF